MCGLVSAAFGGAVWSGSSLFDWSSSADGAGPDRSASDGAVWSRSSLFAIPFGSFVSRFGMF